MRVAFDATSALHAPTGVGVFAHEVLERFAHRDDLDVTAFAISWRGRGRLSEVVPPNVRTAGRPMAARPLRELWKRVDLPPIEWFAGAADVVFGPNFVVPPARRAAEVVTVHDLTCVRFPELCTRDTLEYPQLIRRAIRRGAIVHTVAPAMADEIRATFDIADDHLVCIPNGYTPPVDADADDGRRLAGGDRYVLGLGTIEPRKDFPTLVRAFDALAADDPDLRLVIAGGDGWGIDAFTQALAAARHRDRIVRLGWIDDGERSALLRGASALAFPSIYEGFGLPPLEAMDVGTPVVTTNAGALPDTVGDAALVVEPRDPDALAAALVRVLTDDAEQERLVEAGRRNVRRFSWDRTADALADLFYTATMLQRGRGAR